MAVLLDRSWRRHKRLIREGAKQIAGIWMIQGRFLWVEHTWLVHRHTLRLSKRRVNQKPNGLPGVWVRL